MKNTAIPFTQISSIPLSIKDFLNQRWSEFKQNVFSWHNLERKMEERANSFSDEQRDILYTILNDQLSGFSLSELQKSNLKALRTPNTFTITTGHQLNLFTGSTFFIYKILQTIKTANELNERFPNHSFVPVFWLATEDHDFEEICFFKTDQKKYSFDAKKGGAVGRILLDDIAFVKEFENDFRGLPFGNELIAILKNAYQKGKTLTQSTQEIVQHLFADRGLLFIDGDDTRLKKQMIPIFKDELLNQTLFHQTAAKRKFLEEQYGKVQVNPREINLFYLSDTRNRIVKEKEVWRVLDKNIQWSGEELTTELIAHPQRFSPNAIMRPVYQEVVLPNLAYIGGNGEINYWLELQDYFINKKIPYPILIPRVSMLFLEAKILDKIERLSLEVVDFLGNIEGLLNQRFLEHHPILELLSEKEAVLKQQFQDIKEKSSEIDVTFKNLVEAEEARQLKSFNRMRKRLLRAEKIKHQEYIQRVELLHQKIHPQGIWQERVLNFSQFYALKGSSWLDSCYKNMGISKSEFTIVKF